MQFWSLFREFAVALQTAIEEVQVGGDILVVGTTATEGTGEDGGTENDGGPIATALGVSSCM